MLKMGLPQAARALVDRSLKPVGALNDDVAHAAHWELLFPGGKHIQTMVHSFLVATSILQTLGEIVPR